MKQGWEIKKLTDVCSIQYGCAFDSSLFSDLSEDGMPLIRIRDIKDGYSNTYYKGSYADDYVIHKGDYLIGMDGEFNIEPWKSQDALLNQRVCKIESKLKDVSIRFIYRFLKKELKRIEDETPFVTVKHLSAKRLNQVVLDVPSLPEQEKIVAELDCLSGIIEKKKQQLKEFDALAQSIFYEMFGNPIDNEKGWEVKTLGEIAYIGLGFTHTPQYVEQGVAFLSVKDISKGEINWDNVKYVSQEEYDSAPKGSKPNKGDIMFCRVGTMGKPIIVDTDIPFCTFVSLGYLHLLDSNIINTYVKYWMLSFAFDAQVEANVKGVAIKNLNTGWLKNFKIQIPTLTLQQEFASKIEAIEKQKELIKQSIAETETLFNSRMDFYFS